MDTERKRQALSSAGKTGKNTAAQHERKKKASLRGAARRAEGRKQRKRGATQKKGRLTHLRGKQEKQQERQRAKPRQKGKKE